MKKKSEQTQKSAKSGKQNLMRNIDIEKLVLSCGGTADDLAKEKKLLDLISGRKAQIIASSKRIPDFGVRPGLEVGTNVTLRGKPAAALLSRLLSAIDNTLSKKQIAENNFSFGLKEYIEIPGIEYQREIGIRGLNITVVFSRPGLRVKIKKIKKGRLPKKQYIPKEEIIKYMEDNFKTKFN